MVRREMRVALLADIHSNLPALEAVLKDVDRTAPDAIWCPGDLVGYNPWPNEVLEILRQRHVKAIRGNHDRATLSGDTSLFNELAAAGIRWTRITISPGNLGYLFSLEDRSRADLAGGTVAMYHGSPRHDDEYVLPWNAHEELLQIAQAPFVVLGHTHMPMQFTCREGILVNPGSVGQPRDGDPRAAWGLLDTTRRTFDVHRVKYDVDEVAHAIRKVGLPAELGDRLYAGV